MSNQTPLDQLEQWPERVRAQIGALFGAPIAIEPLHGLSGASVWRVTFAEQRVVVKRTQSQREADVYQLLGPLLAAQGVSSPSLFWAERDGESHWLLLEEIPHSLPRSRWLADHDLLGVLYRLHHSTLPASTAPFRPTWPDEMTAQVLDLLPASAAHLGSEVARFQRLSQPLFRVERWISGDPNPANWGLRTDGSIALFDWERLGLGSPALDLAISVPGLGQPADFQLVAARYLQHDPALANNHPAISELAREIAIAKTWNVVEFLSMAVAGDDTIQARIPALIQALPPWLTMIAALVPDRT
ncbi:MAG: aminoglycoside phosphotransferase family protein [Chloroflexi bacterium]|nr:aminoglycoside phosphotransferase family protein [Chloroflexota bacterium]